MGILKTNNVYCTMLVILFLAPEPQESKGKSEDIDTPKVADSNGEPGEVIEIEKKDTSQ